MPEGQTARSSHAEPDTEKFRLRSFIKRLIDDGQVDICRDPLALADLTRHMDNNPKAVLFECAGPEEAEIVGNVMASRRRLATALDVAKDEILPELISRLATPQPVIEIAGAEAPVQQEVWQGEEVDLTRLPVPFQHGLDGGPYFSATLDYAIDPATGLTNVGCRRLMLRGRRETGIDLTAPSDLKAIYEAQAAVGERLPVSFTLGAHPLDFIAATMRLPVNEIDLVAALRAAPLATVKCVSNDLLVPADAEMVLEGYIDERGHVEDEGPYGEFAGYYGTMRPNPVFHVTAITSRRDALFQTATISGPAIGHTETAMLNCLKTEVIVWRALQTAIREPVAVNATAAGGGMFNLRLSLRQRVPGEARNAIACVFGCLANVKNVFVLDDDIDVFDDGQFDWALGTRFQGDRDLIVESGFRTVPIDPSLDGSRTGSKTGFDLTLPFGKRDRIEYSVPAPPTIEGRRFQDIRAALDDGPKTFEQLMAALGTRDGRDVVIQLDELRRDGLITRLEDGAYGLKSS